MKKVIVVEGIDCAGKTTFIDSLGVDTVIHKSAPTSNAYNEYIEPLLHLPDGYTALDRWHVGEVIYGPLYRGVSIINENDIAVIEGTLDDLSARKVILAPPIDIIKKRFMDRGEDFLLFDDIERVYNKYLEYGSKHNYEFLEK